MEDFKVYEVLLKYSSLFMFVIVIIYIVAYFEVNTLRNKGVTKRSIFTNEILAISRSILLIFISFIFVKYMFLVEIGAKEYFEKNPNHNATHFFSYIMNLDNK